MIAGRRDFLKQYNSRLGNSCYLCMSSYKLNSYNLDSNKIDGKEKSILTQYDLMPTLLFITWH